MPSTGIPRSSSSVRSRGAPSAYTDAGPPERIRPRGSRRRISSTSTVCGSSSLNTPHSRTLRAISCEYWPPKSRTSTSSWRIAPAPAAGGRGGRGGRAHPDRLRLLEVLALGLERRRDHHLGAVERGDVLVAARGHRRAQRPHQVERAVVLVRGPEQDLLERPVLGGLDACAGRERRV